jgi:hypothetical protein
VVFVLNAMAYLTFLVTWKKAMPNDYTITVEIILYFSRKVSRFHDHDNTYLSILLICNVNLQEQFC